MDSHGHLRHPVEQILLVGVSDFSACAVSELWSNPGEELHLAEFPLYIIGTRPRIHIRGAAQQGNDLIITIGSTSAEFHLEMCDFEGQFETKSDGAFFAISKDGVDPWVGRASDLLTDGPFPIPLASPNKRIASPEIDSELLDLKVLYVGKSDDHSGAVNSRLIAHSTMQKILAHIHDHAPDLEMVIGLFKPHVLHTVSAILPTESDVDLDADGVVSAMFPVLDDRTVVALAEAAMIRLFSPEYNVHFKNTFPTLKHSSYAGVFPLAFNSLGIILNTSRNLGFRLWSDTEKPTFVHERAWHVDPKRRSFSNVDDLITILDARRGGLGISKT